MSFNLVNIEMSSFCIMEDNDPYSCPFEAWKSSIQLVAKQGEQCGMYQWRSLFERQGDIPIQPRLGLEQPPGEINQRPMPDAPVRESQPFADEHKPWGDNPMRPRSDKPRADQPVTNVDESLINRNGSPTTSDVQISHHDMTEAPVGIIPTDPSMDLWNDPNAPPPTEIRSEPISGDDLKADPMMKHENTIWEGKPLTIQSLSRWT